MDGLMNPLAVFGPEKLADNNARAGCETGEKADQHIDNRRDRTDGRKRFGRDEISDNDRIDGVVQLLKKISDQQWDRKGDQLFPDHALCHVHRLFLLGEIQNDSPAFLKGYECF